MKINDYVGKDVVIYSGTPTFESGTVVRVVDFDTVSDKSRISVLVMPLNRLNDSALSNPWGFAKWVDFVNIKQVINYDKPTGTFYNLKKRVYSWWMRVSKRKSLMPSDV